MFKDRLIDFHCHLHTFGFSKEATTLIPEIVRYATELGVDLSSPSSQKKSKTQLMQGVKSAVAKADKDTPLGAARVLRKYISQANFYAWLGDTSKCFLGLGNPDDQASVNWFFDLDNGNYVGEYSLAAEDKWSQMLQQYHKWLTAAQEQLAAITKDDNKDAAKKLEEVRQKLVKFQPLMNDLIENYANNTGVGESASELSFETQDIAALQKSVQYGLQVLPDAAKNYKQRSTWVKVAQRASKSKAYQEKLLSIIQRHDPKNSALGFCWKIAREYAPLKLLPTRFVDTERIAFIVGKSDGILVFSLRDGSIIDTLSFNMADAYIRKRQRELERKRKEDEAKTENEYYRYDRHPDRKLEKTIDQAEALKRQRLKDREEEKKARERIQQRQIDREKRRKVLRLIRERNRRRRDDRRSR